MIPRRPDLDDLDGEIRDHIEAETHDNVARGMTKTMRALPRSESSANRASEGGRARGVDSGLARSAAAGWA
jgi:hypothetical protein